MKEERKNDRTKERKQKSYRPHEVTFTHAMKDISRISLQSNNMHQNSSRPKHIFMYPRSAYFHSNNTFKILLVHATSAGRMHIPFCYKDKSVTASMKTH